MTGGPRGLRICCGTTGGGIANGGAGDDRLEWTNGSRNPGFPLVLDGGSGNDTYAFGILFVDNAIAAGAGFDTLDQSDTHDPLDFRLGSCPGCVERVIGTSNPDHIVGDGRAQTILGGDGDDELDGGGGTDVISGQGGDDVIEGRDGTIDSIACDGGDGLGVRRPLRRRQPRLRDRQARTRRLKRDEPRRRAAPGLVHGAVRSELSRPRRTSSAARRRAGRRPGARARA